jgi:hypothetical protein
LTNHPGLSIAFTLALAAAAHAQDALPSYLTLAGDPPGAAAEERLPRSIADQDATFDKPSERKSEPDGAGVSAAVHLRFALPFGAADRDVSYASSGGGAVVGINTHLYWSDLFDSGWGGDIEVDFWFAGDRKSAYRMSGGMRVGMYAAVLVDQFSGNRVEDDFGNFIKASDLSMSTYLVGAKVFSSMGNPFFAGGRMGVGAVHYSSVNGHFGGPFTPEFQAELFEDTWTFAAELRGHGGVKLKFLSLTLGTGLRFMLPPREGSTITMSPGPMWTWDIDLGAEIGF